MLNLVLQILLLAMAIPVLRASQPYRWFLHKLNLQMTKPLDCVQCLTFWTSLALHLTYWRTAPIPAVLASLTAAFLANEAEKVFERL